MFRGINTISLDNKGRIAVPTKHREILENLTKPGQLIITIDPEEHCLLLYPLANWEEIEQKISLLPSFNYAARRIQRLLIGHATEVNLDNQGRILLVQELREYANLSKKIILVGQGKKIEIWDFNYWYEKREQWLVNNVNVTQDLPIDLQVFSL